MQEEFEGGDKSVTGVSEGAPSEHNQTQSLAGNGLEYSGEVTNQTQSMMNYGKLDKMPDRRGIATPQTVPGVVSHNVQQGLLEVYDEDEFNYNFDEKDMSVAKDDKKKSGPSELNSEKADAKELSQLHAQVDHVVKEEASKKNEMSQKSMAGGVLDSEEPSDHYMTVNAYGEEKSPSQSNRMNDSMFNKTGPAPSQMSIMDAKAKQVANMKHAVNSFIGNMINNEILYQRFKKMEEDDEEDMKDLVQEEFKMFEIKEAMNKGNMTMPPTRMTMATRMETTPTL